MLKTKFLATAVLAGAALWSVPALAADSPVVGAWATEAKSDFGTFKSTWTVAQSGDAYTIDVQDAPFDGAPPGDPPKSTISEVMVDGGRLSFKRELVIADMAINLSYTVTVTGDTMAGTSHSDFGDIPITGARVP